jgi:hypothetical protein
MLRRGLEPINSTAICEWKWAKMDKQARAILAAEGWEEEVSFGSAALRHTEIEQYKVASLKRRREEGWKEWGEEFQGYPKVKELESFEPPPVAMPGGVVNMPPGGRYWVGREESARNPNKLHVAGKDSTEAPKKVRVAGRQPHAHRTYNRTHTPSAHTPRAHTPSETKRKKEKEIERKRKKEEERGRKRKKENIIEKEK